MLSVTAIAAERIFSGMRVMMLRLEHSKKLELVHVGGVGTTIFEERSYTE
jgi:hypothetical protein